jgi:hypothetical protein
MGWKLDTKVDHFDRQLISHDWCDIHARLKMESYNSTNYIYSPYKRFNSKYQFFFSSELQLLS